MAYQNPALKAVTGCDLLPAWDERMLLAFSLPRDAQGGLSLSTGITLNPYPYRTRRLGNLDPDEAMLVLQECIRDNQSFFIPSDSSPWRMTFPYARYLRKSNPIVNLRTGETYTIAEVFDESTGNVLLSGKLPPRPSDRLRLAVENEVNVVHSYPRLFAPGQTYSEVGSQGDKPAPWNDTIGFIVTRSEPGSIGATPPFRGTANMKPQHREQKLDPADPRLLIETEGQFFDNLVRFDCWAKTNAGAVSLLRWFRDFMRRHTWIMELFGVSSIWFWRRDEDAEVKSWRTDITKRSVIYYFRTEEVYSYTSRKLSQVRINVDVYPDTAEDELEALGLIPAPSSTVADWPEPSSSLTLNVAE